MTTTDSAALAQPWSRRALLGFALAWLLFAALMLAVGVQDYLRSGGLAVWKPLLWESSSLLVGTALMLAQLQLTRHWRGALATPWRWFGRQALWLPAYWLLFTPLTFGIRHAVYALVGDSYSHRPWAEVLFYESLKITIFIGLFTAVRFGVLSYQQLLQAKLHAERANTLLRQAQLQRLAQQMQPHFLFNALNTISSLMHSDVERADATLIALVSLLRATVDAGERQSAPLAEELRLAQGYAGVMLARFGERASIAWHIEAQALACQLPVLSLQPLLENIFKHTVEQRRALTRITVSAQVEPASALLRVVLEDDGGVLVPGRASDSGSSGIGLANLRARLTMLHGNGASLQLEQLVPAGVRATLLVPAPVQ
ncbi:sensor histidine kinase [Massilia sp. PWRC2]|uniref:sensor histidine kinase n=1 Tax=Massilia sp. PWRC2 TaxID=2804626 RepID=UPI003CF723CB